MSSSLDTLLTQVPYRNRSRVKVDIETATIGSRKIGALIPKIGNFVHADGAENKLVFLGGTVPIFYAGATYNIPVDIYIPLNYPVEAPMVYVRPTGNMIIKQNHRHVDMNGFVYLPYLHEWNTTHSLIPLIEVTSSVFSIEPPLFTKPANTPVATPPPPPPTPPVTTTPSYYSATPISAVPVPASVTNNTANSNVVTAVAVPATSYGSNTYATPTYSAVPAVSSSSAANNANYSLGGLASGVLAATSIARNHINSFNNSLNNNINNNAAVTTNNSYNYGSYTSATPAIPAVAAATTTPSMYAANPSNPYLSNISAQTSQQNQLIAQQVAEKRKKLLADVTVAMQQTLKTKYENLRHDILLEMSTEKALNHEKDEFEKMQKMYQTEFLPGLQSKVSLLSLKVAEVKRLTGANETSVEQKTAVDNAANGAENKEKPNTTEDIALDSKIDSVNGEPASGKNETAPAVSTKYAGDTPVPPTTPPAESLLPADELSLQITKLQGELQACHDAYYYWERALMNCETVDMKVFSRECRELARQEFLCRAHLRKIFAVLKQQEISNSNNSTVSVNNSNKSNPMPVRY